MKAKLFCCKCLFDQIKANLADIKPENHQKKKKNKLWSCDKAKCSQKQPATSNDGKRIRYNNSESALLKG